MTSRQFSECAKLGRTVEQCALLEETLRDHVRQALHHQVARARIPVEPPQQRVAVDIEQPALLERDDRGDTAWLIPQQGRPPENVAGANDRALRRGPTIASENEPQPPGGDPIGAPPRTPAPATRSPLPPRPRLRDPPRVT